MNATRKVEKKKIKKKSERREVCNVVEELCLFSCDFRKAHTGEGKVQEKRGVKIPIKCNNVQCC